MSSTPPSHRSPLTLLSKLKRQLSKSPVTHQPIEHQYLPIPTVSFSESLHSHSTYSCSNKSSSASSFIFIDHNEEPPSVAEDEYRPFLPLIIQHERLQQRLSAVTTRAPPPLPPPPIVPARTQRARRTLPLNEPPSPTSTASSPSPVTPIFTSTFFRTDDEDEDGIMTLSNSEVGSISEYPLPRSLSAYMQEPRSIRSRKSSSAPNSDSESRRGRLRGIHGTSIRTPPPPCARPLHHYPSRRFFPAPISPPPSCPLPDLPVSVKPRLVTDSHFNVTPRALAASDSEVTPSHIGPVLKGRARSASTGPDLRNQLSAPPVQVPSALSSAICLDTETKIRPVSSHSIVSDLEIFHSNSTTTSVYHEPSTASVENQDDQHDDDDFFTTRTSPSTRTPTPTLKQYGVGRQVIRGSGCDFQCDFGCDSTTSSMKRMRDSSGSGMERKETRPLAPESTKSEAQDAQRPCASIQTDDMLVVGVSQDPIRDQSQSPVPRRRAKSDDTNPSVNPHFRQTTLREKPRDRVNPEWTLFLGIPRNAPPPQPVNPPSGSPVHPRIAVSSTPRGGEQSLSHSTAAVPLVPTAPLVPVPQARKSQNKRQTFLPACLPLISMIRNRTKSDSALLASAASPSGDGSGAEHGDGTTKPKSKSKTKQDWTLSLPLVVSPTSLSSSSAVPVAGECERKVGVEADAGLLITVEDVDHQRGMLHEKKADDDEEEKEEDDPLIFRVPRMVRSCSSSSLLSSTTNNVRGRVKKSNTKWMGASSTPNLPGSVQRLSSSTLEEEVMCMLLGDNSMDDDDVVSEDDSELAAKDLMKAKMLAQKKIATLDEDLARFNALLRNGNGIGSQPTSMVVETTLKATVTKAKTVTLDTKPPSLNHSSSHSITPPKKSSSQTLPKPVLKHAKSCGPFLESHSSRAASGAGGVLYPFPLPSLHMNPVMRFPSSSERGNLDFFDELTDGDEFEPTKASLRLSRSAEWIMEELGDSMSTMSTFTSSQVSLPLPHRHQQRTSRNSTYSPSTSTQTLLLPFAHYNTKYAPPSKGSPSVRAASVRSWKTISTAAPVESNLAASPKSQKAKQPRGSPSRIHTASTSSSSSSSASSLTPSFQRHANNSLNDNNRRSITPPLPPSPIPSESSSSASPTPLASAFPLPPSFPAIGTSGLVHKLKEFECAREKQQYQTYKPPSTTSSCTSITSLVSNASSTATVVPSGDQTRIRATSSNNNMMRVQENGRDGIEDEEGSNCSGPYYSARSSFSTEPA